MQAVSGAPGLEAWRAELELALNVLRTSSRLIETAAQPGPDFEAVAKDLHEGHAQLLLAYDREVDPVLALVNARGFIARAQGVIQSASASDPVLAGVADGYGRAVVHLGRAEERVRTLVHLPPAPPTMQLASVRLPRIQRFTRPRLTPHWRFPPPPIPEVTQAPLPELPRPTTFEELDRTIAELKERADKRKQQAQARMQELAERHRAKPLDPEKPEPPPGFARDPLPALSQAEFMQQNARLCFEEVTMVGMARLPSMNEPWRTMEVFDQRMLNSVDAIIALGPDALALLEPWVVDSPAPDPFRVWAITMVLGCVQGRDALAAAERAFYRVAIADDGAGAQFARALKLVPHPDATNVARRLLLDPVPRHRALGIEVLSAYSAATPKKLEWAAFGEPELVEAALAPFAASKHPRARDAISRAYTLPGPGVRRALWKAMALNGDPRFTYTLHQDREGELADEATVTLGALGSQQDADQLFSLFQAAPTTALADALGWAGDGRFIEPLMQVLKGKDAKLSLSVAFALERITRAGLFDEVEVPPEELEEPEAPEPNTGDAPPPLAKLVSDPRDMPEPGSPDLMIFPTIEFNRWHRWWRDNATRFPPGNRYRRGVLYTPLVSWNELDAAPCTPGERRLLQQELIVRSGGYVPFDVDWWVPRQEAALVAWEAPARSASGRGGAWSTPARR